MTACDATLTPDPKPQPPPVEKVEPVEKDAPAQRVEATVEERKRAETIAKYANLASAIGVLQHCRADKLYTSLIIEDSYYRMRALMVELRETGPQGAMISHIAYMAYTTSFEKGILITVEVPVKDNPEADFKFGESKVEVEMQCQAVEAWLKNERDVKGGGLYGVKGSAQDG